MRLDDRVRSGEACLAPTMPRGFVGVGHARPANDKPVTRLPTNTAASLPDPLPAPNPDVATPGSPSAHRGRASGNPGASPNRRTFGSRHPGRSEPSSPGSFPRARSQSERHPAGFGLVRRTAPSTYREFRGKFHYSWGGILKLPIDKKCFPAGHSCLPGRAFALRPLSIQDDFACSPRLSKPTHPPQSIWSANPP